MDLNEFFNRELFSHVYEKKNKIFLLFLRKILKIKINCSRNYDRFYGLHGEPSNEGNSFFFFENLPKSRNKNELLNP